MCTFYNTFNVFNVLGRDSYKRAKHIYISKNGTNNVDCGWSNKPCQSLDILRNLNRSVDYTVFLDGGRKAPMKYFITRTLLFTNIAFIISNNSRFNPRIVRAAGSFAFVIKRDISISFTSILFLSSNLLKCESKNCFVIIKNSIIKIVFPSSFLKIDKTASNVTVFIKDSIANGSRIAYPWSRSLISTALKLKKVLVSVTIKDSNIAGFQIGSFRWLNLTVDNVTFSKYYGSILTTMSSGCQNSEINIINSRFYYIQTEHWLLNIMCAKFIIQNTDFFKCKSKHLIYAQFSIFYFTNSSLYDNMISEAALFLANTTSSLVNMNFTRNKRYFPDHDAALIYDVVNSTTKCFNISIVNNTLFSLLATIKSKTVYSNIVAVNNTVQDSIIRTREGMVTMTNVKFFYSNFTTFLNGSSSKITLSNILIQNNINWQMFSTKQSHLQLKSIAIRFNVCKQILSSVSSSFLAEDVYVKDNRNWPISDGNQHKNYINIISYNIENNYANVLSVKNVTIYSPLPSSRREVYFLYPNEKSLLNINILKGKISVCELRLHLSKQQSRGLEITQYMNRKLLIEQFQFHIKCSHGNPFLRNLSDAYSVNSTVYSVDCMTCRKGTYELDGQSSKLTLKNKNINVSYWDVVGAKCKECPVGGRCEDGRTFSRGSFYGYLTPDRTVKYIECPLKYCCQTCATYNSCAALRTGRLCGECQLGFQEDIFSAAKCVQTSHCSSSSLFWLIYFIASLVIVLVIITFDLFKTLVKNIFKKLKNCILKTKPSKENSHEYELSNYSTLQSEIESKREHVLLDREGLSPDSIVTGRLRHRNKLEASTSNSCMTGITSEPSSSDPVVHKDDSQEKQDKNKVYTFSGLLGILISFYQTKSLLAVGMTTSSIGIEKPRFSKVMTIIFNIDPGEISFSFSFCPMNNVDAVTKHFIKDFFFPISLTLLVLVILALAYATKTVVYYYNILSSSSKFKNKINSNYVEAIDESQLLHRLQVAYLRTLLLIYKNLAFFTLTMVHCVSINANKVLFIQGNRECFQHWQYGIMAFLVIWVIPFPIALSQSYHLFVLKKITFSEMLTCLTIPPCLIYFLITRRCIQSSNLYQHSKAQFDHVEAILTEPYRLLRSSRERYVFWEDWRLIQRLILAAVATYVSNPLERICYCLPCILTFSIVYFKVLPFKPHLVLLHWSEVVSLLSYFGFITVNVFFGFFSVFSIPVEEWIQRLNMFFVCLDMLCSPLTVIVLYFTIFPLCTKIFHKIFYD